MRKRYVWATLALLACSVNVFAASNCPTPWPPNISLGGQPTSCDADTYTDGYCGAPNTNSSKCVADTPMIFTLSTYQLAGFWPWYRCDTVANYRCSINRVKDDGTCGGE